MSEYIVRIDEDAPDDFARAVSTEIVQELVRCGECEFYDNDFGYCVEWQREKPLDWFCADGERKGEE